MSALAGPDGRVAILFSDIEGSTERNEALGDREWVKLLARHDSLVAGRRPTPRPRGEIPGRRLHGRLPQAVDAVRCCIAVQRAFDKGSRRGEGARPGPDRHPPRRRGAPRQRHLRAQRRAGRAGRGARGPAARSWSARPSRRRSMSRTTSCWPSSARCSSRGSAAITSCDRGGLGGMTRARPPRRGRPGHDQESVLRTRHRPLQRAGLRRHLDGRPGPDLGLTKSAIYHHVPSKSHLLAEALDEALDGLECRGRPAAVTAGDGESTPRLRLRRTVRQQRRGPGRPPARGHAAAAGPRQQRGGAGRTARRRRPGRAARGPGPRGDGPEGSLRDDVSTRTW